MNRTQSDNPSSKKNKVTFIKSTPKFLEKLKLDHVQQENEILQKKFEKLEKLDLKKEIYDVENAQIVSDVNPMPVEEFDKEIFKPVFVSKTGKPIEKNIKKPEKQEKNSKKRKNLADYVVEYTEEIPKSQPSKKIKTNLLSFDEI